MVSYLVVSELKEVYGFSTLDRDLRSSAEGGQSAQSKSEGGGT